MGKELCRDEEWTRVSSEYTRVAFGSLALVRKYPGWLRPYIHWLLPCCKEARRKLKEAHDCLKPHLELREVTKQKALEQGKPCPFDDSIEWFGREYGKHDPATQQISISIVVYDTISDLLCETLFNLCQHPEIFKPIRDEIVTVLGEEGGLTKAALYNLKLMESVVKESQRLRPIALVNFNPL
ncbi:ent-kaurene oxidase [Fusarium beomiforme]|uniref:Ent-kaurene oxidase n=1 Tax=Fusarium beomiforme TaxID=44412 RepID=A0A9P5DS40_9HYPO|nr:ent-kaurene oxidase [Fusarium beomiforme]